MERCSHPNCKKKFKLIKFPCICGNNYCSEHRYMNAHNCILILENKKKCKDNIKDNNPEVNFTKLIKI